MLTLSSTDTLLAGCPTANVITYTLFGDIATSSSDSFSVLAQGQIANTPTQILGTNTSSRLIKTITIANTSASIVSSIKFFVNGGAGTNQIVTLSLPANGSAKFDGNGWAVYSSDGSLLTFGLNGRGITNIAKTNTTGLVDTYTITYSDATTSTYQVTNGRGVSSITKTNTTGLVDTYTITYNDATTSTYTVTNGKGIASIALTNTTGLVDTYTITYNDGTTSTYTITNGAQGYIGGITQQFSTTTTATDPGNGKFQFNNATVASVTAIYVDDLSFSGGTGLSAEFATWAASTSAIKGKLIVRNNVNSSSVFAIFNVTSVTTNSGFTTLGVTYVTSSGTFANNDLFALQFARTGDKGDTGQAAYTTTTANFTQPAAAGTVSVSVVNTQWMSTGMYLFIATGGYYTIQSITNTTTVVLVNTGVPENATAGTTINSGSSVSSGGARGATGPQGQSVAVADEGAALTSAATSINFTGAGVTATNTGSAVTVTINGGNSFASVTGNTGTANADASGDSIAITGTNGISTTAADTPDSLTITPSYGSPVSLNGGTTAADGTANTFARSDHAHAIANGGTPTTIQPDATAAQGTSTSLARSDHTHAIVADVPVSLGASPSEGTSNAFSRADHVHLDPVIAHVALANPHAQYAKVFWYDVTLYGISPANTGAQNVTAWNALYSTIPVNSTIYFPAGTYDFASELTLNRNVQIMIRGDGKSRSILRSTSTTANLFFLSISAYYYSFEELGFASTVTKTAGAFIGTNSAAGDNAYLDIRRCEFKNHFVAIDLSGIGAGNVGTISEVLINSPVANSVGIRINGENMNMMLTNVTINHNPGAAGLGTCVEVLTSGAVQFVGCDFIGGQRTLDVNPTVRPVSAIFFTNCFFDQAGATTVLFRGTQATSRVKFLQCGITNGNVANSVALSIAGTGTGTGIPEALDFELCDFYNSFAGLTCTGLSITSVRGIDIRNCRIAGFTVGIDLTPFSANGVTNFNIQGNTIGPTENFPGNGTGIRVNAGAVQYGSYIITDNDLSGNTVAPLVENGTVAADSTEIVRGNIGLVSPPQNLFVNAALPLTTVTRLGAAVAAPANGQRVGTRGRITATLHKSAATASTLTLTLRNGVNNANTDAAVATLALGAGTAATGAATIIAEWQVVTATTAMATIMVKNNGATGVTNAAAANITTLGPIAITNINTASFWGLYAAVATAANIIIDTVSYEIPSQ